MAKQQAKPQVTDSHKSTLETEKNQHFCAVPQVPERVFDPIVEKDRQRLIRIAKFENKWLNGTVLHYYFFSEVPWKGSEKAKEAVQKAFKIWKDVGIGLEFKEVNSKSEAEIRIGFMQGDGSWSYLGRDVLKQGINDRTMNFGWDITRNDRELDTAIHEIGHTLGFPHEHQNPIAGIVWDEDKVYAALGAPPNEWDRQTTFYNIIRKLDTREVEGSSWDPNSVMHYPFEPGLIKAPTPYDTQGINPAGGLSAKDKEYVLKFYPPIPDQEIELKPFESIPLKLGEDRQQNFKIIPDATRTYNISTFGSSDSVLGLFELIDGESRYVKADDDGGEERNATLNVKLFSGRQYILRVRNYHNRDEKIAVMMW
jgi:hypothetical protein